MPRRCRPSFDRADRLPLNGAEIGQLVSDVVETGYVRSHASRALAARFVFFASLSLCARQAAAQVLFDAASNATPATVSTANPIAVSWNHTVGLAKKPYLTVGVSIDKNGGAVTGNSGDRKHSESRVWNRAGRPESGDGTPGLRDERNECALRTLGSCGPGCRHASDHSDGRECRRSKFGDRRRREVIQQCVPDRREWYGSRRYGEHGHAQRHSDEFGIRLRHRRSRVQWKQRAHRYRRTDEPLQRHERRPCVCRGRQHQDRGRQYHDVLDLQRCSTVGRSRVAAAIGESANPL